MSIAWFLSICYRARPGLTAARQALSGACLLVLAGCAMAPPPVASSHRIGELRLIGEQRIAFDQRFMDTRVGGLSGIDYDAASNTWVSISDDRSEENPARFYQLRLRYDLSGFHEAQLVGMKFLRQADGSTYPNAAGFARRGGEVPDLESIRIDPQDGSLWYSSEGVRGLGLPPFVKQAQADGTYRATLAVGAMFGLAPVPGYPLAGPRDNLSFEGLSFSTDGRFLWLGMEAPLYQDGAVASAHKGAVSRITKYARDGTMMAQYAYPIDAIPVSYPGRYADNGVSEILAVDERRLLVIERAGVEDPEKRFHFHIRLYEMDISKATDISQLPSLQHAGYVAASKRLLLDFDQSGLDQVDNIEGVAWGPRLENGHDSLVLVSDNNFNPAQITQLLVFEVLPP